VKPTTLTSRPLLEETLDIMPKKLSMRLLMKSHGLALSKNTFSFNMKVLPTDGLLVSQEEVLLIPKDNITVQSVLPMLSADMLLKLI